MVIDKILKGVYSEHMDSTMHQFAPYQYNKETFWDSLETARSALGISKADVAGSLHINPKQYAVAANSKPNMKLTNAFLYAAAVGLSLDEAVRGAAESRFLRVLQQNDINLTSLPSDSIVRSFPYKGLIPTFVDFVALSPDKRLQTTIISAITMSKADLMQFFYRVAGTEADFNRLFSSMSVADPMDLFVQNGLAREMRRYGSKQEFAVRIGLTLGQLLRYLNHTENKNLQSADQKIATVPLLDKVLNICNSLQVSIDGMMKPLFIFDDFVDIRLESAVDDSDKMYYFRRSFDYFSNIFQALPVLYPIVHRFCASSEDGRKRICDLSEHNG